MLYRHHPNFQVQANFFNFFKVSAKLLPKENFREPFGLPKIKVGSPSLNFRSPELISDLSIN